MKIGRFDLKQGAFLAPMAGVTDRAFRALCIEYGATGAITEMVSCMAIDFGNKKTESLYVLEKSNVPVGIQVFGSHAPTMARVVRDVINHLEYDFEFLDINMGCPVNKIVKNGEGSALMLDLLNAYNIASSLVSVSDKPVSVKMRLGYSNETINAAKFAKVMEEAGVSFLSVHGRTREMFYSGDAMLDEIAKVKQAVAIPVIANGDIFTPEDAKNALEVTGCDAVMVGRGAMGRPWLFSQIRDYFKRGSYEPAPGLAERAELILRQYNHMKTYKTERVALLEMRKHSAWYLKGMPGMAKIKDAVNRCVSEDEFFKVIEGLKLV